MTDSNKLSDPNLNSMCLSPARRASVVECAFKSNEEADVRTPFGPIHVIVNGDPRLPAMFTYHDIGLNSTSCFEAFFGYPDMQTILKNFCVYHINALGQQEDAQTLPRGLGLAEQVSEEHYTYPTMDQLASTLQYVIEHFKLRSFVGVGVGAGANLLCRFALVYPEKVDGLVLINCNASKSGWTEWGYQKLNSWNLKGGQMTSGSEDYLLWHWFGKKTSKNKELVNVFLDYVKGINPTNLGHFISSYVQRTDLGITRETDPSKKFGVKNFKCQVMLIAGKDSAHLDDTVDMNARLDPVNSNWMKFECGGMVLHEAPADLCEAMRCFLQGLGFVPTIRRMSQVNAPQLLVPTMTALRRTSQVTAPNLNLVAETEGAPLRRLSQVTLPNMGHSGRRSSNITEPSKLTS